MEKQVTLKERQASVVHESIQDSLVHRLHRVAPLIATLDTSNPDTADTVRDIKQYEADWMLQFRKQHHFKSNRGRVHPDVIAFYDQMMRSRNFLELAEWHTKMIHNLDLFHASYTLVEIKDPANGTSSHEVVYVDNEIYQRCISYVSLQPYIDNCIWRTFVAHPWNEAYDAFLSTSTPQSK